MDATYLPSDRFDGVGINSKNTADSFQVSCTVMDKMANKITILFVLYIHGNREEITEIFNRA